MPYIIIGLITISLLAWLLYKAQANIRNSRKTSKLFKIGGCMAAILLLLRIGPLRLLGIVNLLIPLIPMIKNLKMRSEAFNAKTDIKTAMTEAEARDILAVSKIATDQEIRQAFKKLMLKNHPDHGGSEYIAKQLIDAKNVLLQNGKKDGKI